jgi:Fe-S oxidoreductase
MAGSFGLEAEHAELSMRMAEQDLLPALRAAPEAMVLANGFSCRHQIRDGAGRSARHVAELLQTALP